MLRLLDLHIRTVRYIEGDAVGAAVPTRGGAIVMGVQKASLVTEFAEALPLSAVDAIGCHSSISPST